jgi:hypothetical protein
MLTKLDIHVFNICDKNLTLYSMFQNFLKFLFFPIQLKFNPFFLIFLWEYTYIPGTL